MHKKSALLVMVVVLLVFFLTTCKKDNPAEPAVKNTIEVTVGDGLSPKYSWKLVDGGARTNIFRLAVYRIEDLHDCIWGVQTPTTGSAWEGQTFFYDGLTSPLTHGTVPSGAEKYGIRDIYPLPEGHTYRVVVQKINGEQGVKEFSR